MTSPVLFGLCGAALIGIGLYGLIGRAHLLNRLLAFNIVGSGIFLFFGSLTARDAVSVDPVPQAMIITGIVVALAGTALGVALATRLNEESGAPYLTGEQPDRDGSHPR